MKSKFSVDDILGTLAEIADAKVGPQWLEKVMALRQMVLSLQEDNLRLLESKRAADQRILELERLEVEDRYWRELEEKYPLRDIGAGYFARVGKRTEDPKEPAHLLCADCFRERKEKLLQRVGTKTTEAGYTLRHFRCNGCGSEVAV